MDNKYLEGFKKVIEDLIDVKLQKAGISKYISAKVTEVNSDGTINAYILPDTTKTVSNLLNKTGEILSVNDSVEIGTKNGKLNNAWVAYKHETNITFLPLSGGTITGNLDVSGNINGITPTEFGYLDNISSNIQTQLNGKIPNNGWINPGETWTYSDVDNPTGIITISGNVTTKYSLGMRIKFTNNGNLIYGFITKLSYSSPNTILTFLHETDPTNSLALYLMTNSAITNNYYSCVKAPYGFPLSKDNWTVKKEDANDRAQLSPTTGVWYNIGTTNCQLNLPIGVWNVDYKVAFYIDKSSVSGTGRVTLSDTNNSDNLPQFTDAMYVQINTGFLFVGKVASLLSVTTKKTLYLNGLFNNGGAASINFRGAEHFPTMIRAVCAYL